MGIRWVSDGYRGGFLQPTGVSSEPQRGFDRIGLAAIQWRSQFPMNRLPAAVLCPCEILFRFLPSDFCVPLLPAAAQSAELLQQLFGFDGEGCLAGDQGQVAGFLRIGQGFLRFAPADLGES